MNSNGKFCRSAYKRNKEVRRFIKRGKKDNNKRREVGEEKKKKKKTSVWISCHSSLIRLDKKWQIISW